MSRPQRRLHLFGRLASREDEAQIAVSLRQWLNDLLAVARVAESLPPPQQTAEASGLERTTRSNRNALFLPALGIVFALMCGLSLCALVPVAVILLSEGR